VPPDVASARFRGTDVVTNRIVTSDTTEDIPSRFDPACMHTRAPDRAAVVTAALSKLPHLAMLPDTAVRVIQLANDPRVTTARMAAAIGTAPELCVRVLRIVNSAFYGFPGEVRSIERAITLMGLEAVKNVAIAASLTRVFHGRPLSPHFAPLDLWNHSIRVGAAARLVARAAAPRLQEEAFAAGLLHDIGFMVELQFDRQKLAAVLARLQADRSADPLDVEDAIFGATHQDFGEALVRHWKLPDTLAAVTGWHHRPSELPETVRTLPLIVHVADSLVASCSPPLQLEPWSPLSDDALVVLQLTREQLDEIASALPAAVETVRAAFAQN
jgi:HD-like signal output (HDOD) protein